MVLKSVLNAILTVDSFIHIGQNNEFSSVYALNIITWSQSLNSRLSICLSVDDVDQSLQTVF
jgi:hypothetical protein